MDRRETLLNAVDVVLAAHREWQETDNPEISPELVERIEDCITVFTGGDMPGDLLDLYSKVQAMNETWTGAVVDADDPEHVKVDRAAGFWKSLDSIRNLRERSEEEDTAEHRPLESVAMLTAQKVSDQQICFIYRSQPWPSGAKIGPGLWDWKKNRPLLNLLEKERAQPGSVIDETFEPFYVGQRKAEIAKRKAAADRSAAARADRIAKLTKPCPETLEELVDQGVSLTQIARMKRSTKAAIRKQCLDEGLPVPADEYEAARSEYDAEPNEAQRRIDQAERPMPKRKETGGQRPEVGDQRSESGDERGEPADDFGGAVETIEGAEEDTPIDAAERLVAHWMESGAATAGEIARAIKGDGGPEMRAGDVKAIVGRLKGDPERLQRALGK